MANAGRVVVTIDSRDRTARGVRSAERRFESLKRSITGLNIVAVAAFAGITAGLKSIIDASSDLVEATNKAQQVFRDSFLGIQESAENAATSVGLSTQAFLESTATLGNLLVAFGLTEERAAGLSDEMVQLASDLASFNNVPVEEALNAIRAALVGESEPIRRFGADVRETRLQTLALSQGLIQTRQTLTASQRAFVAYEAILADTQKAQGDFARTSGELANQIRIAEANIKDAAAELGESLLPLVRDAVVEFNKFIQTVDFGQVSVQLSNLTRDFTNFFNQLNSLLQQTQAGTLFGGRPFIETIINEFRTFPEQTQIIVNEFELLFIEIQKSIEDGINNIISSQRIKDFRNFLISALFPERIAGAIRGRIAVAIDELEFDATPLIERTKELTEANKELRQEIERISATPIPLKGILNQFLGDISPIDITNFIIPFRNAIVEIEKLSELLTLEAIDTQDLEIDLFNLGIQVDNFAESMAAVNQELEKTTLIEIDLEDAKNDAKELEESFKKIADAALVASIRASFIGEALGALGQISNFIADAFVDAFQIADTAFGNLVSSILRQAAALATRLAALSLISLIPGVGSFASLVRLAFAEGGIVPNIPQKEFTQGFAGGGIVSSFPKIKSFQEGGIASTDSIPAMLTPGEAIIPVQSVVNNQEIINKLINSSQPFGINKIEGFQTGGIKSSDTIPSLLTPGEAVIPAQSVQNNRETVDSLIASPSPLESTISPVQQSSNNINISFSGFDELTAQRILQSPEFQNAFADIINNGDLKVEIEGKQLEVIK